MVGNKRIGFIGGGAMAEALMGGIIRAGLINAAQIRVSDVSTQRLAYLAKTYGVIVEEDNKPVASGSDILFLTVKPNMVPSVVAEIVTILEKDTLVVSVAAGISIAVLEDKLPEQPVIRVMPNTPVAVGAGMSAIALGKWASRGQGEMVAALFDAVGRSVMIGEELMDAVTGLSGSGPGYAFVLIDGLADAGVRVGLSRKMAIVLAAQTLLGAAKMVLETGEHPAVLRDGVTSPGGTTIAGIHVLETRGVRAALSDAVAAACEKSREMGKPK